jgi:hypothetical protein
MDTEAKIRENRMRRMLARQGYVLSKSRRRDPRARDYGHYTISNEDGTVVYRQSVRQAVGPALDDIERWALSEDGQR